MKFEVKYRTYGLLKKRQATNIVNKDCPYGYSFCWEKKQFRKDPRYMQELICHWIINENDRYYCQECERTNYGSEEEKIQKEEKHDKG